ncbi:MAG: pilus assembly protein TadG-related protein [Actinomycetota bacterium]|nr:pilus assembly protein TadG-related protein [Actinomycetota bacterium]
MIVAGSMVVFLGMAGLAIDVGGWYGTQRHAQATADAAALAAANDMARGATTTAAQGVATSYVSTNDSTITSPTVAFDTTNKKVTVRVSTTAPVFFAKALGIGAPNVGATAVASWTAGSSACTSAEQSAGQCYAIYSQNATCGSNNGFVTTSASETITGGIHSQGSLNITNGTYNFKDAITYSSGNCSYTPAGNATEQGNLPAPGGNQAATYWPQDYATNFPACPATGITCTGPGGTPSYCTAAAASYSFDWSSSPTGIYCAYGTGTASNPATWNGAITFSNGASIGTSGSYQALTLIGGSVSTTSSNVYIKAATGAHNCVIYALDTDLAAGGTAVSIANGNYGWSGDIFAPHGTVSINSSSSNGTFIEAQNVNITNLSFTGDGPTFPGSGAPSSSGSDVLTG